MTKTNNFEFNVFITNLALYNAGVFNGDYVDFVNNDLDEIWNEINKIRYNPNSFEPNHLDEFFITDYDCTINCDHLGEYENIEKLKEFADFLAGFFDRYGDYAENVVDALQQHCDYNQEIIDLLESEEFRVYPECNSMEDVAYEIVDELGYLDRMPEDLRGYFDYEKFGRDLKMEGHFYYTFNGVYVEIYG